MKKSIQRVRANCLLAGTAPLALTLSAMSAPALAIVPNDNVTPAEAIDTEEKFDGVGMFYRADGFVCTGTLINPRTVLFAAHCVNNRPATDYNANTLPAAFSFNVNALPGFQNWISNQFTSNPDLAVYNINRLYWNAQSTQRPESQGFIEGDIAVASLDTPAVGIPTWSLLFSPLPTPDAITGANGTGYHVNITGYGRSGSGTTGASRGIDWRRRSAENMLGALASFNQRNSFLFGSPSTLTQPLYRLDFDDPRMTNPFDFNLYKDEARVREGTTAGGDSGGPLILDAANNTLSDEDLVIGVLSGGSRFFGPQVFSSYGTESFYQPLYLYWDYIAATNPYRYVTANAGNGAWEDGAHWQTTLDPAYRVIDASGNVVNGLPTSPGNGRFGTAPSFGEFCFDPRGNNPGDGCEDVTTGEATPPARNGTEGDAIANVGIDSNIGIVDAITIDVTAGEGLQNGMLFAVEAHNAGPEFAEDTPQGASGGSPEFSANALPAPTLANGLPGATNFVPNNIDPVVSANPALDIAPRYFDVTLGAAGTTTLNSAAIIDRLTVRNTAGLYIGANGDLTSLIDINQFGGSVNIDGNLTSVGDYTLFAGFLGGDGTLTAPFMTNIMGAISPGDTGTVGTFTIDGNAVLSSGSTLLVDFGPNGTSDRLDINGEVSIGGVVALGSGIANTVNGTGRQYTILTADGGIVDANGSAISTFTNGTISSILSQSFTYQQNAVLLEILAASYSSVIDGNNSVQSAYADLFDQNRTNAALSGLYALDFATAETIQDTFTGLAPVTETAMRTLAAQSVNHLANFNNNRMAVSTRDGSGGTVATLGDPLGTTLAGLSRLGQPRLSTELALADGDDVTNVRAGAVPDNLAIYFAGGLIDGNGNSMPGFEPIKTYYDGYFLAGGIELFPGDNSMVGVSVYHSNLDADAVLGGTAQSRMWGGSLYGRTRTSAGIVLDGQVSLTKFDAETSRTVAFVGSSQTLVSEDDSTGISAALGASYDIDLGGISIAPGVEARYSRLSFDQVTETGGLTALVVDREDFTSLQGRAGVEFKSDTVSGIQFNGALDFVHEFEDGPQAFQANFVNGTGPSAAFELGSTDKNWFEFGMGVSLENGPLKLGVGASTTIGRFDAEARTYSASATIRF